MLALKRAGFAKVEILKIEAIRSSETLVNFYWTTRRHIPENSTIHSHSSKNLKSNI
jgi:hypothetical protein